MKKIFLATMILAFGTTAFAGPGVDEKVLSAFTRAFQNATNVNWTESESEYQVSFNQMTVSSKITYDRQGNIIKTLRYYKEEQLPLLVLSNLKKKFEGQEIFGVVEESSVDGTIYHVTLESKKNWTTVRADGYGTLTVEKKFNKA